MQRFGIATRNFSRPITRQLSTFSHIQMAAPDPILGLNDAFNKNLSKRKVNLGVGAYRNDSGKPYVLHSVRTAEKTLVNKDLNKEYLPITGLKSFVDKSLVFAYGKDFVGSDQDRIAASQTLSGTGACRVAAEFFSTFNIGANKTIYQPNPTWGNHIPIFKKAGMTVEQYPYYDSANNALDFAGWLGKIQEVPDNSIFLVHACAHNPTGMDPTQEQWKELSQAMKKKNHVILLDCAYQGFASGDAERDAYSIRLFVEDGNTVCLAQSFAKNFGLYGERVGAFSVVCNSKDEKEKVESQLKTVIRPMYSNPPLHGARIVDTILSDDKLTLQWRDECAMMAKRIDSMRKRLVEELTNMESKRDWSHIQKQIGMFCYSGLSKAQVDIMRDEHDIYMTADGRISMAGVTTENVYHLAWSLHEVTK